MRNSMTTIERAHDIETAKESQSLTANNPYLIRVIRAGLVLIRGRRLRMG